MKYRTHLCQGIIKALSCDTLLVMMLSLEVSNIIHSHLCQVYFHYSHFEIEKKTIFLVGIA